MHSSCQTLPAKSESNLAQQTLREALVVMPDVNFCAREALCDYDARGEPCCKLTADPAEGTFQDWVGPSLVVEAFTKKLAFVCAVAGTPLPQGGHPEKIGFQGRRRTRPGLVLFYEKQGRYSSLG